MTCVQARGLSRSQRSRSSRDPISPMVRLSGGTSAKAIGHATGLARHWKRHQGLWRLALLRRAERGTGGACAGGRLRRRQGPRILVCARVAHLARAGGHGGGWRTSRRAHAAVTAGFARGAYCLAALCAAVPERSRDRALRRASAPPGRVSRPGPSGDDRPGAGRRLTAPVAEAAVQPRLGRASPGQAGMAGAPC